MGRQTRQGGGTAAKMEFKTLPVVAIGRFEFERQDGNSEALLMARSRRSTRGGLPVSVREVI